ncbi:MAG: type II/IV secretion system protein, partial [Verrucomicrobia bacterium]|nr:type II/IV secretion system protein [Verrucomicrobiota bacterium]
PVVRIVNSIMIEALRKHASDIHIEPMEKKIRLRYRIDGILYESPSPPKSVQSAISSRIKIMSNLDIAERRIPQDGRFKIKALGKEVDIRVSYLPTVFGEKIVMRILDKSALSPSLEALRLEPKALADLKFAIAKPYGMLLVTGPTGSGKTTTLYSALQELNKPDVNIITVEDPVEYQLAGINQVQARSEVGLTFAAGLRSILRQDPDIVMIGEIRDNETASIAVQAALTGHLVLSTLHTNDAAGAIARMAYMGIEPFLLSSSLVMTQAQRLYRKLCPFCKKAMEIPEKTLRTNHMDPDQFKDVEFFSAKGCPKCGGLGYKGRGGIMEILLLDDVIKAKILETAEASALREVAVKNGMRTLRDAGLDKVRAGETTIDEVIRVTTE